MTDKFSAQHFWKSCGLDAQLPSLEEVQAGADRFRSKVNRRNMIEYVASAFVIVVFTIYVFVLPIMLVKIGSALVVLGTFVVVWQLYTRASPLSPADAGTMSVCEHLRAQLVRQRDALASVFWWYLAPFIPGLGLMIVGKPLESLETGGPTVLVGSLVPALPVLLVFYGIWWLNRRGARMLQAKIDEIDALMDDAA
jgi:hypothetical protein